MDNSSKEGTGIADAIASVFDGGMKFLGIKSGGLSGFAERAGIAAMIAIPAIVVHSRLAVKPAIVRSHEAERIVSDIPLGNLTFGAIKRKQL